MDRSPLGKVPLFSALLAPFFTTGCATAFLRSDGGITSPPGVYPATAFDASLGYHVGIRGELPLAPADPNEKSHPLLRVGSIIGGIIDMPFSIVADTLFLPLDLYWRSHPPSGDKALAP